MKILSFLVFLCAASLCYAFDHHVDNGAGYAVCDRIINSSQKTECVRAVSQASFIDEKAAEACGTVINSSLKLQCLKGIVDREIDERALNICRNIINSTKKVECIHETSRPVRRASRCPHPDFILEQVSDARVYLKRGDIYSTDRTLHLLERRLEICR